MYLRLVIIVVVMVVVVVGDRCCYLDLACASFYA